MLEETAHGMAQPDPLGSEDVQDTFDRLETEIRKHARCITGYNTAACDVLDDLIAAIDRLDQQWREPHGNAGDKDGLANQLASLQSLTRLAVENSRNGREAGERLRRQLIVALRSGSCGNRRREPRVPIILPATLVTAAGQFACRTANLSAGGALLALRLDDGVRLHVSDSMVIDLGALGRIPGVLIGRSEEGLHIAFDRRNGRLDTPLGDWLERLLPELSVIAGSCAEIARELAASEPLELSSGSWQGAIDRVVASGHPVLACDIVKGDGDGAITRRLASDGDPSMAERPLHRRLSGTCSRPISRWAPSPMMVASIRSLWSRRSSIAPMQPLRFAR